MKIILNEDVRNLGEEGDVCVVADGYARNFLIPRGKAVVYSKGNAAVFETRRASIENRKEEKRLAARGLKEKIEDLSLTIPVPAGTTGKLFGSVSNLTLTEALAKEGIQVERKKVELTDHNIKMIGKYTAKVKLYGGEAAAFSFEVVGVDVKGAPANAPKAPVQEESTPADVAETTDTEPTVEETPQDEVVEAEATETAETEAHAEAEVEAEAEPETDEE